jgi:hypothetical protein
MMKATMTAAVAQSAKVVILIFMLSSSGHYGAENFDQDDGQ